MMALNALDADEMAMRRMWNVCLVAQEAGWRATLRTQLRGYKVIWMARSGAYVTGPMEMDPRVALEKACDKLADHL